VKDYAKSRDRQFGCLLPPRILWGVDHEPLVQLIVQTSMRAERLGAKVRLNFSLADFSKIDFEDIEVFTLVAHWVEVSHSVELFDGIFTVNELAERIPNTFKGTFDLTICHSLSLQSAIKQRFSTNLTIGNAESAMLEIRLLLYLKIIEFLNKEPIHFITARGKITRGLLG
jgi:hypothetical protein